MNKHSLFELILAIEDMEVSIEMAHSIERELSFARQRFDKEIEWGIVDLKEYQHKLQFIEQVYYVHVLELENRLEEAKKIATNLYKKV